MLKKKKKTNPYNNFKAGILKLFKQMASLPFIRLLGGQTVASGNNKMTQYFWPVGIKNALALLVVRKHHSQWKEESPSICLVLEAFYRKM